MNGYGSLSFEHIVIMVMLIMWACERLHNSTLQHGIRMINKMKPKNEQMPMEEPDIDDAEVIVSHEEYVLPTGKVITIALNKYGKVPPSYHNATMERIQDLERQILEETNRRNALILMKE